MDTEVRFSIKLVSKRTGLSTHIIRKWEERYSVVSPLRTDSNRRLYTLEDIRKLNLLASAVASGMGIGQIAKLDTGNSIIFAMAGKKVSSPSPGKCGVMIVHRLTRLGLNINGKKNTPF